MKKLIQLIGLLVISSCSLLAQTSGHFVVLNWTDTQNPVGTKYNLYRLAGPCTNVLTNFTKIVPLTTLFTYTDNNVSAGLTYCYYVTATDGTNESGPSPQASATIGLSAPSSLTISNKQ